MTLFSPFYSSLPSEAAAVRRPLRLRRLPRAILRGVAVRTPLQPVLRGLSQKQESTPFYHHHQAL